MWTLARIVGSRPVDCARWAARRVTATVAEAMSWREDTYGAVLPLGVLEHPDGAFERVRDALLAYRIFPRSRMVATVCTEDGRIAPDATIVQRVRVGAVALEAATRVIDLVDDAYRHKGRSTAFAYATVEGHPERGVAWFSVRELPLGALSVGVQTRSRPAGWLTLLSYPIARRVQVSSNRAAVAQLAEIASGG